MSQNVASFTGTRVTHGNGVRADGKLHELHNLKLQKAFRSFMPILKSEPDLYPLWLLDGDDVAAIDERQWWAMYTLARREKELMRRLRRQEIGFYCPLVKRKTRSPNGRARQSYVPLFGGYVFVHADASERHQALGSNCISRCLVVPDHRRLLTDLRHIRQLIESDASLTPEARIQPGRRVRVRSGSMMGLEGTVIKRRGKDWLVVAVEFLQQGASVLLEDFQVEPV